MPDVIEDALGAVGETLAGRLDLVRLEPAYRAMFADGSELDVHTDADAMTDAVARFAGPSEAADAEGGPHWDARTAALFEHALVVNATPLGMVGHEALDLDLARAPASLVVVDNVYVPLETPLLAAARARGLRHVEGLGMLLHQAVPGFRAWFGVEPTVDAELRQFVAADLLAR